SHRFAQLEQNLARLEEMVTQTQLLMAQLNERLEALTTSPPAAIGGPAPVGGLSAGEARTMYEAGVAKAGEGAYSTARAAFEALLDQYPNDPLAPEAQYQLAETYYLEQEYDRAIEELEKVERQWPRSARAPAALLRAGVISEEQGERDAARAYYEQVRQRFPSSDEAREAARRLEALRG
ncbi:MAG: tol-pal system protein YbgF, partial [Longimicrobiales bacterium]